MAPQEKMSAIRRPGAGLWALALILGACGEKPAAPPPAAPAPTEPAQPSGASSTDPGDAEDGTPEEPDAPRFPEGGMMGRSARGTYWVEFVTDPDPLPLNEMFTITVTVYDGRDKRTRMTDVSLDADAAMPHHGHGMNMLPRVSTTGPGEFLVRGMQLHMPGYWELYFDITLDGRTERAQFEFTIE